MSTYRWTQKRDGLALLLVVSLLGLLTLLVVSLALATRVQTQVSSSLVARAQARQNALFATSVATGQLQRYAGPDTRVTARADGQVSAAAPYANNPMWSGVWTTERGPQVDPIVWLVSGSEWTGRSVSPSNDLSRMTNPNEATVGTVFADVIEEGVASVAAPKVTLAPSSQSLSGMEGRYAWWASDESQKARTPLANADAEWGAYLRRDEIEILAQNAPRRTDLTAFETSLTASDDELARAGDFRQLGILDPVLQRPSLAHQITAVARGVLSSTIPEADGGLRTDLAIAASVEGVDLSRWKDLSRSMQSPGSLELTRIYDPVPGSGGSNTGTVIDHIAPVLTDFAVGVYVFSPSSRNQDLTVRLQLHVELWNPYSSELEVSPLRVRIHGLPTVTISCSNGDQVDVDLDALLGGSPEVDLVPLDDDLFRFLPGRVLNWVGFGNRVNGRWQATPNSKTGSDGQVDFAGAVSLPNAMNSSARLDLSSSGSAQLRVELIEPGSGDVLSESESPTFEPLVKASYSHTSVSGRVAYRFRLADRSDYVLGDPEGWFFEWDPRSPVMDETRFVVDQPQPGGFTNFRYVSIGDPSFSIFDRSASTQPDATSLEIKNDVVLFELPRMPLVAMGDLQHLGFVGVSPFALGNRWQDQSPISPSVYDRYFASGEDAVSADFGATRNGKLRRFLPPAENRPSWAELVALNGARSSRYLLQEGPLNLNTTDADVWAAFLGANDLPDWREVNVTNQWGAQSSVAGTDTALVGLRNAQFRFGQSAPETFRVETALGGFEVEEKSFYRRGVTELTADELQRLARGIGQRVGERLAATGPFQSIGEFVESGLLQDAIDAVAAEPQATLNTAARLGLPLATASAIDPHAPSYLQQADVLNTILPAATVRGDTFILRLQGEFASVGEDEAVATRYAEVEVQRTVAFTDPSDLPESDRSRLNALNFRFGRRFIITRFQWLPSPAD
ncbi:hypothetical protein [Actomonas aquatica]|uniref:Type 4 fimbrial biogenesis protein PilX N-terminal domain-containing protein n=1 Tax=Actomonas aquatica TaxID=2866162 RepID=A0ABZ1C9Q1_9BACT|nr:hypothetical protein [Opitutus sp. WL0086]WRQ88127.1 hypothetical protein K1X11_001825 [Opitutus sp. WL0086]